MNETSNDNNKEGELSNRNPRTIFSIESDETNYDVLHVEMSAANLITFDLKREGLDYHEVIRDICVVAPHMMGLDGDLQEAYDDAFRTEPKREDELAVIKFLNKYKGRLPDDLIEMFR